MNWLQHGSSTTFETGHASVGTKQNNVPCTCEEREVERRDQVVKRDHFKHVIFGAEKWVRLLLRQLPPIKAGFRPHTQATSHIVGEVFTQDLGNRAACWDAHEAWEQVFNYALKKSQTTMDHFSEKQSDVVGFSSLSDKKKSEKENTDR